MRIQYRSSLQRTVIIYFIMISFASCFIMTEFVLDVQKKELRHEISRNYEKLAAKKIQEDEAFHPIERIKNKAILMVVLLLVVVVILLTMFIKNITGPLQKMIEVSKIIATGDLSQTVSIGANNELAEMGNTVNDLTSNLQEMLLLSKDMCDTSDRFAKEVLDALSTGEMRSERVEDLREKMRIIDTKTRFLNNIILNCKFYGIGR